MCHAIRRCVPSGGQCSSPPEATPLPWYRARTSTPRLKSALTTWWFSGRGTSNAIGAGPALTPSWGPMLAGVADSSLIVSNRLEYNAAIPDSYFGYPCCSLGTTTCGLLTSRRYHDRSACAINMNNDNLDHTDSMKFRSGYTPKVGGTACQL